MEIEKSSFIKAALKIGLSSSQTEEFWSLLSLEAKSQETSKDTKFDISKVFYFLGAMIVIVSMTWFIGAAWESFGGGGMLTITLLYMGLFLAIGRKLWNKEGVTVAGGLFITMSVCLIPLAVYSFERWTGLWITEDPGAYKDFMGWVKGGWFLMELATILGGCIAIRFYPFPFLTAPIFFSLWFMSIDITPLIFQGSQDLWNDRLWVSILFGVGVLMASYYIDIKSKRDFAFWGYLFGVLAFWIGLSLLETDSEFSRFLYLLVNVGLILLSVFLQRTVFIVFGAFGILDYVTTLFYRYFSDSALFPVFLTGIGVSLMFIGILYHKKQQQIDAYLLNLLPKSVQSYLPGPRKKSNH